MPTNKHKSDHYDAKSIILLATAVSILGVIFFGRELGAINFFKTFAAGTQEKLEDISDDIEDLRILLKPKIEETLNIYKEYPTNENIRKAYGRITRADTRLGQALDVLDSDNEGGVNISKAISRLNSAKSRINLTVKYLNLFKTDNVSTDAKTKAGNIVPNIQKIADGTTQLKGIPQIIVALTPLQSGGTATGTGSGTVTAAATLIIEFEKLFTPDVEKIIKILIPEESNGKIKEAIGFLRAAITVLNRSINTVQSSSPSRLVLTIGELVFVSHNIDVAIAKIGESGITAFGSNSLASVIGAASAKDSTLNGLKNRVQDLMVEVKKVEPVPSPKEKPARTAPGPILGASGLPGCSFVGSGACERCVLQTWTHNIACFTCEQTGIAHGVINCKPNAAATAAHSLQSQAECDNASQQVCENIKNGATDQARSQAIFCFNNGGTSGIALRNEIKAANCYSRSPETGELSTLGHCMADATTNCRNTTTDSKGNTCTTGPARRSCPIGADGDLPQRLSDCENAARSACYGSTTAGGTRLPTSEFCDALFDKQNAQILKYQSGEGVCPSGQHINSPGYLSNRSALNRACGRNKDGSYKFQPPACANSDASSFAPSNGNANTDCESLCVKNN